MLAQISIMWPVSVTTHFATPSKSSRTVLIATKLTCSSTISFYLVAALALVSQVKSSLLGMDTLNHQICSHMKIISAEAIRIFTT
jgi:hypothetical protein